MFFSFAKKRFLVCRLINSIFHSLQGLSEVKLTSEELMLNVLNRKWMLQIPDTKIHQIMLSPVQGKYRDGLFSNISFVNNSDPYFGDQSMGKDSRQPSFYVVRDDLLHPLVNGNKARKLDGLIPLLVDHSVTDVVRLHFFWI